MLQKLQHRSTFSCTDRTRKEEGARRGREQRWQSSTEESEEELLVQLCKVLLEVQNYVHVLE